MAFSISKGCSIKGISVCLPKTREDNLDLIGLTTSQKESLVNHTGIRYRYVVQNKDTNIQTLFQKAAKKVISDLKWNKDSIDIIIVISQSSSTTIPSIACKLQNALELPTSVIAFDINLGCSGFVYGLNVVFQLLKSFNNKKSRAILCCGDISSSLTEPDDLTTKPIFSDAVSATGIEYDELDERSVSYFNLETFGSGQNIICTETIGSNNWMRMNGIDVFNYSVKYVPNNINSILKFSGLIISDIEQIFLHQANELINKTLIRSIKADINLAPKTLYEYGNTASASIPLTMILHRNKLKPKNNLILLSGFGVGFSVASVILKIDTIQFSEPIFIEV